MRIEIDRSTLVERMEQVTKALNTRSGLPILEGVLIESNGTVKLECSDTHMTIRTELDDYEEHAVGAAVIPAKKLLDVVKKMPDAPITIEVDGTSATIKCGSTKVKLPAMDAEEFPRKSMGAAEMMKVSGEKLSWLVDRTKYAVSTNEQTPVLTGILIHQREGMATAIATDRHRLAKQAIDFEGEAEAQRVVPVKVLEIVTKLKSNFVDIGFTENEIFIKAGSYQYIAALHDGNYPDTSKIIPSEPKITIKADTQKLLQTLELAEKIVEEKTKIVKIDVSAGKLVISAEHEGSSMEEELEVETDGEMKIAANARYLIDALKCIEAGRTEIWLTGQMNPVILKGEGDQSGLHLVLPYRTQGTQQG